MSLSNRDMDRANEVADQERQSGLQSAQQALAITGCKTCIDCGEEINAARIAAAPFTRRCFPCQTTLEWNSIIHA